MDVHSVGWLYLKNPYTSFFLTYTLDLLQLLSDNLEFNNS